MNIVTLKSSAAGPLPAQEFLIPSETETMLAAVAWSSVVQNEIRVRHGKEVASKAVDYYRVLLEDAAKGGVR